MYNAGAEIGTGFLLIIMILFPARRAILLTFLYWNWLRMRYFSPDAATYHSMVRHSQLLNCGVYYVSSFSCEVRKFSMRGNCRIEFIDIPRHLDQATAQFIAETLEGVLE